MIITLQTLLFFRESLINAFDRLIRPYYSKLSLVFGSSDVVSEDDESDEQVFAEFDEEKGVVFFPPVYLQRYAAVSDCLIDERWCGKLEKIVELGYHDLSFIKYLKEIQGIKCILGVDIESIPLHCSMDLIGCDDYMPKREKPLEITLFKGNAADPDYRLIGCDAVVAIEMIEHMLPHDLDRLIHTVFGFIKPQIAIFTTPNGDFNVLFKALEKNGLRRLDHFFEWSREQFHDWCSNIVIRYPQYTVSCKGIGPGPNGTKHLGCCSQMAVFVAKEYHKQQDLNLNSLALVSGSPFPNSISNLVSTWDSKEISNENNMIEPAGNIKSYTELYSEKQSSITIILSKPPYSLEPILYKDKKSQCNLDAEKEKNYLMFDYDKMCLNVLKPSRNEKNRVYYIEDVYNRLNCTTLEVKKFSKTTQNLIAKNKLDTLVHSREVVDEIRHLIKMLNFNKESKNQLANGTYWCNINWGENAPYWNQYYKIVKEYTYPFEIKSDESRILELISDEINRLIDSQRDKDFSIEGNKLEIPIEHLMNVVEHITDDVEKVKDLLEWNGYELVGNMVIHSRLAVDYFSTGSQDEDFQNMDIYSDWDSTDIHSTSISDEISIVPDYHARCLRRALDQKVRKLRSMFTKDEDITTELDKVVCRLMKLALRTSSGRNAPPPTRWMQCKLLDLLTLTEKAIERKKIHFMNSYSLKAINYEEKSNEMFALEKIKEDKTALNIVDKYDHLINKTGGEGESQANYRFLDFNLDDDLSISSGDFSEDFELRVNLSPNLVELRSEDDAKIFHANDVIPQVESKLEKTQAWVKEDIEVVPYPDPDNISEGNENNATKYTKYYKKKYKGKPFLELNCVICKRSHSKAYKHSDKEQSSKTKLVKKGSRKKSSNSVHVHTNNKYVSVDYKNNKAKPRRKQLKSLFRSVTKGPIQRSLVDLCNSEIRLETNGGPYNIPVRDGTIKVDKGIVSYETQAKVADTKQSLLIDIVTDDAQETIALRRTIGTDGDSMAFEDEMLVQSFSSTLNNDALFEKHNVSTENVHSQTIFLYDIDEPTTSKGIRHVCMDVQCGPDVNVPVYSMLSATTSLTAMPRMYKAGIKIGNSTTDTKVKSNDYGTSISADSTYKTIIPQKRSVGIKIKDSDSNLCKEMECSIVPVYSMVSATTSLTKMSHISTSGVRDFTTNIKTKSTECGTCTNNAESINLEKYIDTKIKTELPKQILFSTNTQNSLEKSNASSSHSEENIILGSLPKEESDAKTEDFLSLKKKNTSDIDGPLEIPKQRSGFMNRGLNLPEEIGCSTNTEQFHDKKNVSLQHKSVDFKLKKIDSNLTEASKYAINTQKSSSTDFTINDPDSNLFAHTQSSTNMRKSYSRSHSLSPQSPHQTRTKKTTLLKSSTEMKNDDSIVDYYVSDDGCNKIQIPNALQSNCLHDVNSFNRMVGSPERIVRKYTKPKLCKGGVQVHSYRDKQTHSEDIMYQGEWQRNRPKVLTRKKCFNPLAPKNVNGNLKKKANSTEKIKIMSYPKEKNHNKYSEKRDVKPEITRILQPRKTTQTNSKDEPDKSKIKQNLKLPKTAGVATLAKPFRNIVKVPSKFPMSYSSAKKLKPQSIIKKSPITSNQTVTKDDETLRKNTKKDYIPLYLKQRTLNSPNDTNKKDTKLSLDSVKSEIKNSNASNFKPLIISNTEEIESVLVKSEKKTSRLQYNVYHNEIEKKKSDGQHMKNRLDSSTKRTSSPKSSTSSSSSSIETVRAVSTQSKNVKKVRYSTSSYTTSTGKIRLESPAPDRNRKFTNRSKSAARATAENKENIPQASKKLNTVRKESVTIGKSIFIGHKTNVYVAHVKENSPLQSTTNTLSKQKTQKSNVNNMPKAIIINEKRASSHRSPSPSLEASVKFDTSLSTTRNDEVSTYAQTSNMVLVIEPQSREIQLPVDTPKLDTFNHRFITDWIDNINIEPIESQNITTAIRGIIEETLDFIDDPLSSRCTIDSETVIQSVENLNSRCDLIESPTSLKTIINSDDYCNNIILPNDLALTRSFDVAQGDGSNLSLNDTRLTATSTDIDTLSFKSLTSESRISGYLSADNEFSSSIHLPKSNLHFPNSTSVREIYERKEQPYQTVPIQNIPGSLANQAFSGFTINEDPVSGDQPDLVNFIDSETGSLAADVVRQAASEELLISGRSSDTFESCVLDDDTVVPNWLFQMINHQQSAMDEIEPPAELMGGEMPDDEAMFDDNGNIVEGLGQGAGAGDGRGVHSDQSQDSSGRGTSVSSSEFSSGPESEAVLVDPSAYVAQFEMLRDAVASSVIVVAMDDPGTLENIAASRQGTIDSESLNFSRGESRRLRSIRPTASDIDADVSSIDTDVPDSSDN